MKNLRKRVKYAPCDKSPEMDTKHIAGLDPGITKAVWILRDYDIETVQSCEGGPGHCYTEPTVEFCGNVEAGYRALGIALGSGLPVHELRRVWCVQDQEAVGPHWAMTFWNKLAPHQDDKRKIHKGGK